MRKTIAAALILVFPLIFSLKAFGQESNKTIIPIAQNETIPSDNFQNPDTGNNGPGIVDEQEISQAENDVTADNSGIPVKDDKDYSNTQEQQNNTASPDQP